MNFQEILYKTEENEVTLSVKKTIENIDLSSKNIIDIDLSVLAKLPFLVKLDLSNNLLKEVNLQPLKYCPSIQEINLSNNQLDEIDLSFCYYTPDLRTLNFSNNCLRKINLYHLILCEFLNTLDLSNNSFTELDLTAITSLPALKQLILSEQEKEVVKLEGSMSIYYNSSSPIKEQLLDLKKQFIIRNRNKIFRQIVQTYKRIRKSKLIQFLFFESDLELEEWLLNEYGNIKAFEISEKFLIINKSGEYDIQELLIQLEKSFENLS